MAEPLSAAPRSINARPAWAQCRNALLASITALLCQATASAASDVDVVIESEDAQTAHGYMEMWVRVTNRSGKEAHEVRLNYASKSFYASGYLSGISRTITVDPNKTARVALSGACRFWPSGNTLAVTIDGRDEGEVTSRYRSSPGTTSYGGYGTSSAPRAQPTVLYSQSVDPRFLEWTRSGASVVPPSSPRPRMAPPAAKSAVPEEEPVPGAPPKTGGLSPPVITSGAPTGVADFVRANSPVALWSPNWLGYSRLDGIVVTDADLRSMPDEVRSAVGQYVECGGSLLVLGRDPDLPGKWKLVKLPDWRAFGCQAGFGTCLVIDPVDFAEMPQLKQLGILDLWKRSQQPWLTHREVVDANSKFPVVDDVGVPVGGLLALMIVFVLVAGPGALILLARRGRSLWLFWVVPVISAVTCILVFGYIALSEGWSGRSRIAGITILDENTRRASSLGWSAFYTPLSTSGGLHFSPNTELSLQYGDDSTRYGYSRRSAPPPLNTDWTREQHLVSGWISPRIPAHFLVRKSEIRPERVTFSRGPDGRPEAVNGLGADLTDLWYEDEKGNLFHTQNVAAGAKASLDPVQKRIASATPMSIGSIYTADWSTIAAEASAHAQDLLKPLTYLAVMDATPFFDAGMPNAKSRGARSALIGIIREGGDEN